MAYRYFNQKYICPIVFIFVPQMEPFQNKNGYVIHSFFARCSHDLRSGDFRITISLVGIVGNWHDRERVTANKVY